MIWMGFFWCEETGRGGFLSQEDAIHIRMAKKMQTRGSLLAITEKG
jgi:hypothetical protein